MSTCIKCKAALPEGAIYCPMCGKKQVAEKRKTLKRANGTGSVYKLPGRRTRPWVAAKGKVIIGYYERKTDALETLDKLAGHTVAERYNFTFAQVYDEWSKEHYRSVSASSIAGYGAAYKKFAQLHAKKFRDLRTADFQTVIDANANQSISTLNNCKLLASQMSKWAIREEITSTNFATFVRIPQKAVKEKEIFTPEEIASLTADDSDTARVILMLIYTGMRVGELFKLPVKDYHGAYAIGGEKTKAGKNRVIPIRPEGQKYFEYFTGIANDERLLSGYAAKNTQQFREVYFYPLLDKLGIRRKTPHSTRHTYASWALQNGIAPENLQKILGHKKFATTAEIYYHSDADTLVSAVLNASNRVSNPKQTDADEN